MIWLSTALAGSCTQIKVADVSSIPAPAVIVLGERMGTAPDLVRARKVLSKLSGPTTLALQIVPSEQQKVLDRHHRKELPTMLLESELGWSGFPFSAYQPLFNLGIPVVAAGVQVETKPQGTPVPLPPGYGRILSDGMAGHAMPADLESPFVQLVSWFDHRVALQAIEGWDGKGHLVILADRAHVEGGKGISWQAQRLTDAPVHAVLLSGPGACYADDQFL